jgi:hypothetical protein
MKLQGQVKKSKVAPKAARRSRQQHSIRNHCWGEMSNTALVRLVRDREILMAFKKSNVATDRGDWHLG